MFHREQHGDYHKKQLFSTDKLFYNREMDCSVCPMGQAIDNIEDTVKKPVLVLNYLTGGIKLRIVKTVF